MSDIALPAMFILETDLLMFAEQITITGMAGRDEQGLRLPVMVDWDTLVEAARKALGDVLGRDVRIVPV